MMKRTHAKALQRMRNEKTHDKSVLDKLTVLGPVAIYPQHDELLKEFKRRELGPAEVVQYDELAEALNELRKPRKIRTYS